MSWIGVLDDKTKEHLIRGLGTSARPTSIDIDVTGNGTFSVQAVMGKEAHVVFATVPILTTNAVVRHYKFRAPKSTDFGEGAGWSLAATGSLTISAVARFSMRSSLSTNSGFIEVEKPVEVAEGLSVQELPRQWRYAPTVAR